MERLAAAVEKALQCGADIGDASHLAREFEGPRQLANRTMIAAIDSLQRLFVPGPLSVLGSAVLDVVDLTPQVRALGRGYCRALAPRADCVRPCRQSTQSCGMPWGTWTHCPCLSTSSCPS